MIWMQQYNTLYEEGENTIQLPMTVTAQATSRRIVANFILLKEEVLK